ncbi:hypothetical protein AB0D13_03125 [Streptomyces sp. NPDC048430]|uniref:hypothetical protein n=1 Tax=Streptomyces sp. NPDC048430 TaxID=3155388 RepID=UPI0034189D79
MIITWLFDVCAVQGVGLKGSRVLSGELEERIGSQTAPKRRPRWSGWLELRGQEISRAGEALDEEARLSQDGAG